MNDAPTEACYCCKCKQVVQARVTRTADMFWWHCTICGICCDQDFVEYEYGFED